MGFFRYDISSISPAKLCTIPMIVLALSLVIVGMTFIHTGLPIKPGMEFTGGIGVTIVTEETPDQLKVTFADYPLVNIEEGINQGKYLKFDTMSDEKVLSLNKLIESKFNGAKIDQIGSSFGKTLQDQAAFALIISFIGMSIVVFLIFRTFVPSAAVVISAFADMTMSAAVMNLLGIQLSLGTTAALLMLIGYSVDSDILLTSRVLKRQGKFDEKVHGAFITGIIMTSTAFCAVFAMWVVSWIGGIEIIHVMSQVLLIGLIFDVMNTWLTNVGILKWYASKGKSKLSSTLRGGV
ncbi:protein translocase subunit SecF [uncultured Methanospirillum sp.]|uniref:protein translocase subunit SecF n=1 Tax=uncultured Methanospirillum sp. TaxID=262503 RepID=UPI0029C735A5|nr:protein translocase subunit SecF [uncultured Methanospirillum sp.]